MKYSIEMIDNDCVETIEMRDEVKYIKRYSLGWNGFFCQQEPFEQQLRSAKKPEDIVERVSELLDDFDQKPIGVPGQHSYFIKQFMELQRFDLLDDDFLSRFINEHGSNWEEVLHKRKNKGKKN